MINCYLEGGEKYDPKIYKLLASMTDAKKMHSEYGNPIHRLADRFFSTEADFDYFVQEFGLPLTGYIQKTYYGQIANSESDLKVDEDLAEDEDYNSETWNACNNVPQTFTQTLVDSFDYDESELNRYLEVMQYFANKIGTEQLSVRNKHNNTIVDIWLKNEKVYVYLHRFEIMKGLMKIGYDIRGDTSTLIEK